MSGEVFNNLTNEVIGAAIEVHKQLGPGLLESVYEECLLFELSNRDIKAERQVKLPLCYKEQALNKHFVIDLLVDDKLIVEIKAVEDILSVHEVQLVTYLKLADKKLGLLINFNESILKHGIRRRINGQL